MNISSRLVPRHYYETDLDLPDNLVEPTCLRSRLILAVSLVPEHESPPIRLCETCRSQVQSGVIAQVLFSAAPGRFVQMIGLYYAQTCEL